jgi:hypothetical protein
MQHAQERRFDEPLAVAAGEVTNVAVRVRQRLWEQMARECEAMAQHALSTGRTIPLEVVERLDQALSGADLAVSGSTPRRPSIGDLPREEAVVGGTPAAERSPLASLYVAHGALAQIIAPATPGGVLLLAAERATHPLLYALGPLPIGRLMLGLAILSLLVLLGIPLSEEVNPVNMGKTMMELTGFPLFIKEAYLFSAASLGSSFQNLQRINVVVSNGTFDPKFQSTYWTRWAMGVISGIIIAQLIFVFLLHTPTTGPAGLKATIGQPLLALLGGYSVDLVHGILSHTINTLGSFFRGSRDGMVDNQTRAWVTGPGAREVDQGLRPGRPAA